MPEKRPRTWSQGKLKKQTQRRNKGKEKLNPAERRRMTQLLACMLLFAVVFVGRGLPSGRLSELSDQMGALIHQNTDFVGAFSRVGQAVTQGEPFVETFGQLWSEVIGSDSGQKTPPEEPLAEGLGQGEVTPQEEMMPSISEPAAEVEDAKESMQETAAPETVVPVMGTLTSAFGPREHPIDGAWKEHQGVDLAVDEGTPILAYAAGEVDYVGESDAYGLYLQLKHADGITTFYAHCSDICVKVGQQVAVGDVIAAVGETGNATGPHLHFEIKQGGVRLDPAEYIEILPAQ